MKVLFDTNVIVDIWGATSNFELPFEAFDIAVFLDCETCICAAQVPQISYVLPARKLIQKGDVARYLKSVFDQLDVVDTNDVDCRQALAHYSGDYEDDLIQWCAWRHNVNFIVTSNIDDFKTSPVPALTPAEFVRLYKPTCLNYEMAEF